ncbi:MAG TPA: GNAT family N-acetyltransferase [Jatrophihabitans sp.]|nr:GNAT family N-acetyltransferase [Jatrophihabitans sp.]
MPSQPPVWQQASDPDRVTRLLELSDRAVAGDGPVPRRNPASTSRLVRDGSVFLLTDGDTDLAMITVCEAEPTEEGERYYPPTERPAYMRRLAVHPDRQGSLLAMQAVQHAIRIARQRGATALRCETNPDNEAALRLLQLQGFRTCSPSLEADGTRHVLLWRAV